MTEVEPLAAVRCRAARLARISEAGAARAAGSRRSAAPLARDRAAQLDEGYRAYEEAPLDTPDEWGDLASFREAAARS